MSRAALLERLDQAYTEENLHRISTRLIDAYRAREYGYLRALNGLLGDGLAADDGRINKLFASLIMKYHPDRLAAYRAALAEGGDSEGSPGLEQLEHILVVLQHLEAYPPGAYPSSSAEPRHWTEEYVVDEQELTDLGIRRKEEKRRAGHRSTSRLNEWTFMEALQYEEFGSLDIRIERSDLENLQGPLSLSNCGISDLEGIQYCTGLIGVDLSANRIMDATLLGFLFRLQELDLSNNRIDALDGLSTLVNLEVLDVSNNQISDITPILSLYRLRFVNLLGNPVPAHQIDALSGDGVVVVS